MKNSAFTLLETMIYIALFGVLMSGALVTVYALLGSIAENQRFEATYTEALFVNQKLAWELADATSVVLIDSQTLQITQRNSTVLFTASSSQWWLAKGSSLAQSLSGPDFIVSDVVFGVTVETPTVPARVSVQYHIGGVAFSYVTFLQQ